MFWNQAAKPPDPNTATAVFLINVTTNKNFDRPAKEVYDDLSEEQKKVKAGFAVFGRVTEGMKEVVDKIAGRDPGEDERAVRIKTIRRIR
jgi:cyclophilin family peptidyl-prolyl cis-trans isomerase